MARFRIEDDLIENPKEIEMRALKNGQYAFLYPELMRLHPGNRISFWKLTKCIAIDPSNSIIPPYSDKFLIQRVKGGILIERPKKPFDPIRVKRGGSMLGNMFREWIPVVGYLKAEGE